MQKLLLYTAYGWLLLASALHFCIDVVSSYWRGKRAPSVETTLYYGLHSAYTLGQILFAIVALLLIQRGVPFFREPQGWLLGFVATAAWLAICGAFIEYRQPRIVVGIFAVLLAGAALTR
ncbi:MAG: hypothetical protein QOK37_262 [Thermoanaerobaculia bacterium]|jgi:hypothetical protein|nr:hypothetical protein [Thermoanaerobaculia bacterium]